MADFKKERGLSIRDAERERELIDRSRRSIRDPAVAAYYVQFLRGILDLSCAYQSKLLNGMKVAYSGVKGAYGYLAARRMFPEAQLGRLPRLCRGPQGGGAGRGGQRGAAAGEQLCR